MSARPGEWRREVSGTLEAIEEICAEFQLWRARACPGLDLFSTELLLRESLTNSVLHGCSGDPHKHISCVLRLKPGRLLIAIRDDGEGFNWRDAWNRRAEISDTHGRGMEILRRYANSVRFNPKGNSVTLIKRY
jgi:serine/threonine-protein kinase RsbW